MKKLTANERQVVYKALSSVIECMGFDEDFGEYTDGDRFVFSLDKEDFEALKSAVKKL